MYKIKTMNKIAKCGTDLFDKNNFVVEETETPTEYWFAPRLCMNTITIKTAIFSLSLEPARE